MHCRTSLSSCRSEEALGTTHSNEGRIDMATALPSLAPAPLDQPRRRRPASSSTKKSDDQAAVVKSLCKTYTHTVTKLLYAFSAVRDEMLENEGTKATTVGEAIATGQRDEMLENISVALAGGVEQILRSKEVAVRTGVLRDLRARFAPKDPPAKADAGVQAVPPKERKPKSEPQEQEALKQPETQTAPCAERPASAANARTGPALAGAADAAKARPASAALLSATGAPASAPVSAPESAPKVPEGNSFASRQMAWELRKLQRIEERRVDKEAKEREAVKPTPMPGKAAPPPKLYAHVQSAIKMARKQEDDSKLAAAERRIDQQAQELKEAAESLQRLEQQHAHAQSEAGLLREERDEAEAQLRQARVRQKEAEQKYEKVKGAFEREQQRHADELEVRDAFDELGGLQEWPMVPGKRVLPVGSTEDFDGRISQEFRQKDAEGGEKGISLLMGRRADTGATEVQCIIFDPKHLKEVQMARWWQTHRHRFEKKFRVPRSSLSSQKPSVS